MAHITDITEYRMRRAQPALQAARWHEATEIVMSSWFQIMCAWQRIIYRQITGQ